MVRAFSFFSFPYSECYLVSCMQLACTGWQISVFLAVFFSLELILHWYLHMDISDVPCNFAQG